MTTVLPGLRYVAWRHGSSSHCPQPPPLHPGSTKPTPVTP